MTDEAEFTAEFDCAPDIPFYLRCPPEVKDEARRAYVLAFISDAEGVLLKNWDEEAAKLEAFLKSGTTASDRKGHMKVVK